MKKIRLLCASGANVTNDPFYGTGGSLHEQIETHIEEGIDFVGYTGSIDDVRRNDFVRSCKGADAVMLDVWAFTPDTLRKHENKAARLYMANIAAEIRYANPHSFLLAQMLEGRRKREVHESALPFNDWRQAAEWIASFLKKESGSPKITILQSTTFGVNICRSALQLLGLSQSDFRVTGFGGVTGLVTGCEPQLIIIGSDHGDTGCVPVLINKFKAINPLLQTIGFSGYTLKGVDLSVGYGGDGDIVKKLANAVRPFVDMFMQKDLKKQ